MNRFYPYLEEAFSRNIGFLSLAEQERLHRATVALPGLGGVGGAHLVTLARLGIGRFHLADFDRFEIANVNRQLGARAGTFGRPKLDVMRQELRAINPFAEVRAFPEGITAENIDVFLSGVDLLVDSIDFFSLELRRLLFLRARQKGIPAITAAPLGFGTALIVFHPERGMSFDQYFDLHDRMSLEEKLIAFFVGLAPRAAQKSYTLPGSISMSEGRGPSLSAGCQIAAAATAAEAMRILLGKPGLRPAPCYCQYDPFARRFHQGRLLFGNRGPIQQLKRHLLKSKIGASSDALREPKPKAPHSSAIVESQIPIETRDYLLQAAIRAPSGDNCQPWRFVCRRNTIHLRLDPAADNSFFNVDQIASLISCGAAAENLILAAGRCGLAARVISGPAASGLDISLTADAVREDPLQRFIWERHTNRTRYDGRPLAAGIQRQIEDAAAAHGANLLLLTDKRQIREAARLVAAADQIRSSHRQLHEHLMAMIRFTSSEALVRRDGFPLKNLEAGAAGEWLLRHTRRWQVMALLNRLGLGKMISKISYQGMCSASAIGLLKIQGRLPEHFVQGGRALERIWLTTASLGLDFQPMTAITLFRLRWQLAGKQAFSPAHQRLLQVLWPRYERLFEVAGDDESHILLFRIGWGRPVACRTLRKPIASFIANEDRAWRLPIAPVDAPDVAPSIRIAG